jgi:mono/diheme cytochrome c family protein
VEKGDAAQKTPACSSCHGLTLTGVTPNIPGLLGLPRDYLNAQLGAWKTGQRHALAPDCMADIAKQLRTEDVTAVVQWLAAQTPPANTHPASTLPALTAGTERPRCGSAPLTPPDGTTKKAVTPAATPAQAELVRKGAYLAQAGNCQTCHTAPDGQPFAGGRAIATPFGVVYSSNLSSDKLSGLGNWSAEDFWQALHHGRSKDGRLLNPAFPYSSFSQITRADSDALFAYFQTIPPSNQANRAHELQWPLGTQAALALWRTLYFKPEVYQNDAARSAQWNRGAYLVRGLGHCGECHTPRNPLGASKQGQELTGATMPMQHWYAPSLRLAHEAGVTESSAAATQALLKTGTHNMGVANGPMAEVVQASTQYLSDADLQAMTVYLQSLSSQAAPGTPTPPSAQAELSPPNRGAQLYNDHCAVCHGEQGQGVNGAYPALANNRAVKLEQTSNLIQTVLHGGFAPSTQTNPRPYGMPPFMLQLKDQDTAAVLTYIRSAWGNQARAVSELDVSQARNAPRR